MPPSTPPNNKNQGLIDEYRRDPQKFKHYAEMFDTVTNAKQVIEAVSQNKDQPCALTAKNSAGLHLGMIQKL